MVEIVPPEGNDPAKELAAAKYLRGVGIDAINIPDSPRASARMSNQALCTLIERGCGIETVLHYTCRDRNVLSIQSDLLGACALGIHNLICITGDPPKLGNYPDATAVFDVDSIGLVNIVHNLNLGVDIGGNSIGSPTAFVIGVGANPGITDMDEEIRRFEYKCEAGARLCGDPAGLRHAICWSSFCAAWSTGAFRSLPASGRSPACATRSSCATNCGFRCRMRL